MKGMLHFLIYMLFQYGNSSGSCFKSVVLEHVYKSRDILLEKYMVSNRERVNVDIYRHIDDITRNIKYTIDRTIIGFIDENIEHTKTFILKSRIYQDPISQKLPVIGGLELPSNPVTRYENFVRENLERMLDILRTYKMKYDVLHLEISSKIRNTLNFTSVQETIKNPSVIKEIKYQMQKLVLLPYNELLRDHSKFMDFYSNFLQSLTDIFEGYDTNFFLRAYIQTYLKARFNFFAEIYAFVAREKGIYLERFSRFDGKFTQEWIVMGLAYHKNYPKFFMKMILLRNALIYTEF